MAIPMLSEFWPQCYNQANEKFSIDLKIMMKIEVPNLQIRNHGFKKQFENNEYKYYNSYEYPMNVSNIFIEGLSIIIL